MAKARTIGNMIAPPRFLAFMAALLVTFPIASHYLQRWALGAMAAFDVAAVVFLLSCVPLLGTREARVIRDHARANDANRHVLLAITGVVMAVLLTAIVLAGRTASAFTAQIGAMQSGEEIDAIRTLGLNPIELLVLPRLFALVIMLPLLTFLAMISGLAGGLVVGSASLGISPEMFYTRLHETVEIRHFWVGLSKAPLFAIIIALIGCLEGFQTQGTAQSVGERTTSSVVQTISLVILVDAFAALFFMQMDW